MNFIQEAKTSFGNGVGRDCVYSSQNPLIFIEAGVKINQYAYLKILKAKVVPWVKKVIGNKGITLQQDRATHHTDRLVQNWC